MSELPDELDDRVYLITGATSGIGREAALELGARGATVAFTGRDRERGRETLGEIRERGGDGVFLRADFTDFEAVRGVASEVRERYGRLDALLNNAAASLGTRERVGDTEAVFVVNHLAPYLLTHELLDTLEADGGGRVVTTASGVHYRGDLRLDDLAMEEEYDALDAYARSKLANVLFTSELAARLADRGRDVTANCYHPGFLPGTGLWRDVSLPVRAGVTIARALPFVGSTVGDGADGLVYLATSPDVDDVSGEYFSGREVETPDDRASDEPLRDDLWSVSADLVGVDADWP